MTCGGGAWGTRTSLFTVVVLSRRLTDASIRYSLAHSGRVGKRTRNQEVQGGKLDGGQKEDDGYGARKSDLEVGGFPATKRMMSSKSLESNRQEDRGLLMGPWLEPPERLEGRFCAALFL